MTLQTPYYLIDEQKLIQNLESIQHVAKAADVEIILAFKAFAAWKTFPIFRKYINSATASSLNEVLLCHEEMEAKPHTYCVAYEDYSFDEIVSRSSHLTFNSLSQYRRFIARVPREVSVGLRVNPEWSDVETEVYNPASPSSRLGITADQLMELPDRVEGLHFHVLCESSAESLGKVLINLVDRFGQHFSKLKWINMGGGHLINKEGYDHDLLIKILRDFKARYQLEVILEPGSAFLWQTGDLHTSVIDLVNSRPFETLIFNGSFTCHMPDCLEMPYRPDVMGASKDKIEGAVPLRLGGVSCLAGDFLSEYWFREIPQIGDELIFRDMIHYTLVKTTMFNGVHHPSILLKRQDGSVEVLRAFDYEDYKIRM